MKGGGKISVQAFRGGEISVHRDLKPLENTCISPHIQYNTTTFANVPMCQCIASMTIFTILMMSWPRLIVAYNEVLLYMKPGKFVLCIIINIDHNGHCRYLQEAWRHVTILEPYRDKLQTKCF